MGGAQLLLGREGACIAPPAKRMGRRQVQQRNVTDPVCGLQVDPRTAPFTSTFQGKTYYFTDPDCKRMFDEDPAAYVGIGSVSEGGASTSGPGAKTD